MTQKPDRRVTELDISGPSFDQPPCPVRAKVIICSTPRTGSYLLCRAMIAHGIGIPHEYFQHLHAGIIGPRLGVERLADGKLLETDAGLRENYIAALLKRRTINGTFAAKVQWWEFSRYLNNPEGLHLFQNAHFVYLYRENLLDQAISVHLAMETGRWGFDDTVTTPPSDKPDYLNAQSVDSYLETMAAHDMNWRLFFARNRIAPLTISYERLISDLPAVLRATADTFGLDVPAGELLFAEPQGETARDPAIPSNTTIKTAYLSTRQRVTPAAPVVAMPPTPVARPPVRTSKRLGIIVPYRDRAEHLAKFLPHVISYFAREHAETISDVKIVIVEQNDDLNFNRGALLNAGFMAIENGVDFVCFHDVDYLPMWADYACPDQPTRIIWWGMHSRPIRVNDPARQTQAPRTGLGAVVLFTTAQFRAVNGFSNRFFGWGFEDKDLATRCARLGLTIQQRDGTFLPLDHDNAGFQDDGTKSPAWLENERRFAENQVAYQAHGIGQDGLTSFTGTIGAVRTSIRPGLDEAEVGEVAWVRVSFGAARTVAVTVPTAHPPVPRRQTICLAMIVKNEAPIIARCLDSVRPLIDHWIICDTGSTDGTQDIIRAFLHDIPGQLHERPWVDFAHNRTEALDLARSNADYSLIIDADDVLELPPGFKLPFLKDDSYTVQIVNKERHYWRPQLVRNAVPWRFEGVLHEFLSGGRDANGKRILPDHRSQKRLPGLKIRMSEEGARRRTIAADRFRRDAALLEKALAEETDEFLISRYTFYLAQSYHDAGDPLKAVEVYMRRAELGGWDQERYISLYRSANLKAGLGHEAEDVIATYLRAHDICKNRAEALHGAAMFCREKERHQQGYELARRASLIRLPDDALFVETWIYDYGVLDEYAVNAYFAGKFRESRDVCRKLLAVPTLPDTYRSRIKVNLEYAEKAAA